MSFITKLLRKAEPLPPLEDATAPLDASAIKTTSGELLQPTVESPDSIELPEEQAVDAEADVSADSIPDASDNAWGEEETSAPAAAEPPAQKDPADQQSHTAVPSRAIVGPTQPLKLFD